MARVVFRGCPGGGVRVFTSEGYLNPGFALTASYFSLLRQRQIRPERTCTAAGWPAGRSPGTDFASVPKRQAAPKAWLSEPWSLQGRYATLSCASRYSGRSSHNLRDNKAGHPCNPGNRSYIFQTDCRTPQNGRFQPTA